MTYIFSVTAMNAIVLVLLALVAQTSGNGNQISLEYLDLICVDQPEIFCTCAHKPPPLAPNVTRPAPTTTRLPALETTTLFTCSRQPIILYLLWIEDDFGLRNHKNSHKMGEFLGYFLQRLHQQLKNSNDDNYTIQVRSIRKDKSKDNKYGIGV